jgi:hypothetical protein
VYSCTGMSKWAVIGELGVKFGFVYTRWEARPEILWQKPYVFEEKLHKNKQFEFRTQNCQ